MRAKTIFVALVAAGAALVVNAWLPPAHAMGRVSPSAIAKTDNTRMVEKVHRRRWNRSYRGYRRYPSARWYRTRPYYYGYAPYYRSYYYPPYGAYYVRPRRYYDYGYYGYYRPRVRIGIGF